MLNFDLMNSKNTEEFLNSEVLKGSMGNYPDSYNRITKKIGYLEEYIANHDSDYASSVGDELKKIVDNNPYPSDAEFMSKGLEILYRDVREKEKKVPSLINSEIYPSKNSLTKFFPSIDLNTPLEASLDVKENNGRTTLYLGGSDVVSYSNTVKNHIGKRIDINEESMEGYLFFNTDFFTRFDIPKEIDSGSDMRNIAKGFFNFNDKNHVALVQYLEADGFSKEHYHSLPEIIVQLAGETHIELRDADNDLNVRGEGLEAGDLLVIPPRTIHKLVAYENGSITVPIKQTNKKRSDHFYQEMSYERLTKDIDDLIRAPHYNSGTEILCSLEDFYDSLRVKEKENFIEYLDSRLTDEKNLNIKEILEECQKRI